MALYERIGLVGYGLQFSVNSLSKQPNSAEYAYSQCEPRRGRQLMRTPVASVTEDSLNRLVRQASMRCLRLDQPIILNQSLTVR
jgi:hypothetical protein